MHWHTKTIICPDKTRFSSSALLGIVYATDAYIEPGVKVVGVFPDNSHDPIIYPVAATVNAKPATIQYLAFLRSAAAKSIFQGYGFSVLAKPTS